MSAHVKRFTLTAILQRAAPYAPPLTCFHA
jgi:hypothetical protein